MMVRHLFPWSCVYHLDSRSMLRSVSDHLFFAPPPSPCVDRRTADQPCAMAPWEQGQIDGVLLEKWWVYPNKMPCKTLI